MKGSRWAGVGADVTGFAAQRLKPTRYYFAASPGSAGTMTPTNGRLTATPVFFGKSVAIDALFAETTTAGNAGAQLRLGIYADDGTGDPGALIIDGGTVPADAAAVAQVVIPATTLAPGLYWFAVAIQNAAATAPVVRAVSGSATLPHHAGSAALPGAGAAVVAATHNATVTTGGLPAAWVPGANPGGAAPRTGYRAT